MNVEPPGEAEGHKSGWSEHGTDEKATEAQAGLLLRTQVGSGVHGTAVEGQDDRDEMGICTEGPNWVVGLRGKFGQYIYRSKPEGVRSGAGDLDLTVYSLRKWMRLSLSGNPTVLLPLFVPESEIVAIDDRGRDLRANAGRIVSQTAGKRFLGYMHSQRDRLLDVRGGKHTNRPELIDLYGYDTKYAMHLIRLGIQGIELMNSGRITLPVPEPHLSQLRALRQGGVSFDEATAWADDVEIQLHVAILASPLPVHPDKAWADLFVMDAYRTAWGWT